MGTSYLTFFINITTKTNISLSKDGSASPNAKLYYSRAHCRFVYKPPYSKG